MLKMNRRFFLQASALTTATVAASHALADIPGVRSFNNASIPLINNPIAETTLSSSLDFNGDDITRPHDVLWDLPGYLKAKGGEPLVDESREWVVVGGGMSGLLSAYYLKDQNPLLLEQSPQFGGNSKAEQFKDSKYSMGAAYFCVPSEGSDAETLLTDLGLLQKARLETDTKVFYKGQVTEGFWEGSTDPERSESIREFNELLKTILAERYPEIPYSKNSALTREELNELDRISFADWLKINCPNVSEHVREYCQLYAWSSFVASIDELSAAQMLNFIAAETDGIMTLPGGNAAITEALYQNLCTSNGSDNLKAGCIVLQVKCVEGGVEVLYEDSHRRVRKVFAKKCIMAAPKFVAKYILPDMPAAQKKAINAISYRGYIVANVILNKKIESPAYDVFSIQGKMPVSPSALKPPNIGFTDVCFGTWAQSENVENSVLTIYKALPMDGARQFLFSPFAHDKNKKIIMDALPEVLSSLGLNQGDILGIRMTRWGHSLPVARKSFIADGMPEIVSQPVQDKIFFANQDNWVNSCFECALQESIKYTVGQ